VEKAMQKITSAEELLKLSEEVLAAVAVLPYYIANGKETLEQATGFDEHGRPIDDRGNRVGMVAAPAGDEKGRSYFRHGDNTAWRFTMGKVVSGIDGEVDLEAIAEALRRGGARGIRFSFPAMIADYNQYRDKQQQHQKEVELVGLAVVASIGATLAGLWWSGNLSYV
jgi:hypothetical protein